MLIVPDTILLYISRVAGENDNVVTFDTYGRTTRCDRIVFYAYWVDIFAFHNAQIMASDIFHPPPRTTWRLMDSNDMSNDMAGFWPIPNTSGNGFWYISTTPRNGFTSITTTPLHKMASDLFHPPPFFDMDSDLFQIATTTIIWFLIYFTPLLSQSWLPKHLTRIIELRKVCGTLGVVLRKHISPKVNSGGKNLPQI